MFEFFYKELYGLLLKVDREFVGVGDVFLMIFGFVFMNFVLFKIII